jgi:DNA-binding IclR family transcriptional regulator
VHVAADVKDDAQGGQRATVGIVERSVRGYGAPVPGSIQSIERAAAILRVLGAGRGPLRLAEVATSLQLAKGTAHGILRTLVEVGFIEQDRYDGRYRLGPGLADLHTSRFDVNEVRARSMNWADPLAARTGEAVRVGVLTGLDVLVAHYVFRPDGAAQKADVGALLPAHATALGKALLAYEPGAASLLPAHAVAYTTRTVAARDRLLAELTRVREHGYAVEVGEHAAGVAAIAVPVFGPGGLVVAAVGVHGDQDRVCAHAGEPRPRIVAHVLECARAITRELAA